MSQPPTSDRDDQTILILAPSRRDAPTVAGVLERACIAAATCESISEICKRLSGGGGAGAALIAEEALAEEGASSTLLGCLDRQPAWSEPPIILVTAPGARIRGGVDQRFGRFASVRSMILLERPLRSATLVSAVRSALRARQRQYQVRDHLRERERVEARLLAHEQELRRLNEELEERVRERTVELEHANSRLMSEIEQRETAERALRQAQKMEAIGQLTGGIAHDFNNLLMVITGGLDMLERADKPERGERLIAGMRQAVARGVALTGQLLAFSRRLALSPEAIDLRAFIEGMQILVAGALREDIRVETSLPAGLWPVQADPTQLELALLNLAVNARDAMPDGGALSIRAANVTPPGGGETGLAGDFVRIEVTDTGTGIPPEILDRVFDPFFTTKPVGKGPGLGLSQLYGFAKQSGGHVEIASRPGAGATVVILLPRAASAAVEDPRETAAVSDDAGPDAGRRKVLVVEDNDGVAALTVQMLVELGFSAHREPNAPAALAALADGHSADLVFSDVVMPGGMNGIELARALKRRDPDLPVILTTGYTEHAIDRAGFDGFPLLKKPYRLADLQAVLHKALEMGGNGGADPDARSSADKPAGAGAGG